VLAIIAVVRNRHHVAATLRAPFRKVAQPAEEKRELVGV